MLSFIKCPVSLGVCEEWKMLRMAPGLWKGSKDFCHYCSLIGLVCLCLWAFILSPLFSSFFPGLALIYSSRHSSVVFLSLGSSCVFLHFSSLGYTFPAFLATWLWLLSYCCYWFTCPHGLGARTTSFCFLSLFFFFFFFLIFHRYEEDTG